MKILLTIKSYSGAKVFNSDYKKLGKEFIITNKKDMTELMKFFKQLQNTCVQLNKDSIRFNPDVYYSIHLVSMDLTDIQKKSLLEQLEIESSEMDLLNPPEMLLH